MLGGTGCHESSFLKYEIKVLDPKCRWLNLKRHSLPQNLDERIILVACGCFCAFEMASTAAGRVDVPVEGIVAAVRGPEVLQEPKHEVGGATASTIA